MIQKLNHFFIDQNVHKINSFLSVYISFTRNCGRWYQFSLG